MEQWLIILSISILFLLLVILHTYYQSTVERKLFLIRLHSPLGNATRLMIYGVVGGLFASILIGVVGLHLQFQDMLGTWLLSLILIFVNLRYLNFIYASGLLSLFAWITQVGFLDWNQIGLSWIGEYLAQIEVPSLLALAGILHLTEALLLFLQGNQSIMPLIHYGQRGKLVGGNLFQRLWFVPLVVLMPSINAFDLSFMPDWWPLFGSSDAEQHISIYFIPVMLAYTETIIRSLPKQSLRRSSGWLTLLGIIILGLSYLGTYWSSILVLAALFTLFAHEMLILYRSYFEKNASSYYSHTNKGLSVLAVLSGSPADEMGIRSGEIISKVNGQEVTSTKQFYMALQHNAAFCKLEVINLEGNIKFIQRSLYSGDHHLLGLIFSPDEETSNYLKSTYTNFFHLIMQKVKSGRKFY